MMQERLAEGLTLLWETSTFFSHSVSFRELHQQYLAGVFTVWVLHF